MPKISELSGQRIVVTRAVHQAEELAAPLRELGAGVILLPTIAIVGPADAGPLREAAGQYGEYDWIVFTSANAVRFFAAELPLIRNRDSARVAAIGNGTREAAEKEGFTVSLTPQEFVTESLADAFRNEELRGRRVLIPSAAVTRAILPNELRKRGATVDVVEAYRNVIPSEARDRAPFVFREERPDWVTFTSSSAVENLLTLIDGEDLAAVKIATLGPITSNNVRRYGLPITAEANPHTVPGLIQAIRKV